MNRILDDEPSDGDVAGRRVELPVVGQHPDEHDRARHRQRDAEHDAGGKIKACRPGHDDAKTRGDGALDHRAGDRDLADREQFLDVELQANAEHEQNHTNFRELLGERAVSDVARRVGADEKTGDQYPTIGERRSCCVR